MRTVLLSALMIMSTAIASGQTLAQIESVVSRACKTIERSKGQPDSIRVQEVVTKHMVPFVQDLPKEKRDSIMYKIYFRLQRNCPEFKKALDGVTPPNDYWKTLTERPAVKIDRQTCRALFEGHSFYYFEPTGDTVHLSLDNGIWVDHFKDGSYSKLSMKWIDDCQIEIEFIESNNAIRKYFSNPGDKYRYLLVDRKDNYYELCAEVPGVNSFSAFKLYFTPAGK